MANPRPAMAGLYLAEVLLLLPIIPRVAPQGACEQQLRYRQSSSESASSWISTVALLSSICATWLFAFYALQCLCAKRGLCEKEPEAKCKSSCEVSQACDAKAKPDACSLSQPLACPQPGSGPRKPASSQAQLAYAHQLACMEKELVDILQEVRSRRCAFGDIGQEEKQLAGLKQDTEKLKITIYEIADCEAAGQVQQKGRKRKVR